MVDSNIENGSSIAGGFVWKLGERFLAQGITFIVSIILARLLSPADYGIVSIVLVFITFADVFVSNGFSTALIQKRNADETDFSTIFYCSLAVSIVAYFILFVLAPVISKFYDTPVLIQVIRIFGLRLPISSLNSVQHAYVSRHMLFKEFFFSTLGGTLLSGIAGIFMAYKGFGVWAIVAQYLINTIIDSLVLLFTVHWHPQKLFSFHSGKQLMSFGWKVTAASFLGTFFGQLRSLIIGKIYTPADLAFYDRGKNFSKLATDNISTALMVVLFPQFANSADNLAEVKNCLRTTIQVITYLLFPVLIGMVIVAKPMILIILNEEWLLCVPFVKLLSLSSMVTLIGDVSLQAINAIGRSDVTLKLELIKKPMFIILLLIGIRYSVIAVAVTTLIYSFYATFANVSPLNKYLNYSFKELIGDILPAVLFSVIMGLLIYPLGGIIHSSIILLISQIVLGIVVYIGLSLIFNNKSYYYILDFLMRRMNRV